MRIEGAAAVALAALAATDIDRDQVTFRARTDVVLVDVAVTRNGKPVAGLIAREFFVTDAGVAQEVLEIAPRELPIDLSLTVDVSGSMNLRQREVMARGLSLLIGSLGPEDGLSAVTFGAHIREHNWRDRPPRASDLEAASGSAVLDAVLLALTDSPKPGRRRLAVVMTDADDSASFLDARTVTETAKYAAGPLSIVLPSRSARPLNSQRETLRAVADATGGEFVELRAGDDPAAALAGVVDRFRAGYLIAYSPRGVAPGGWHPLEVRVKVPGVQVRARRGYWRSGGSGSQAPASRAQPSARAPIGGVDVVARYPHDRTAFTQGLVFVNEYLYESTGRYGQSRIRQVELATGLVLRETSLAPSFFGEGLTVWKNRALQLTWRSGMGFIYDLETLKETARFTYPGDGWGLTHDGDALILSDGTAALRFLDPDTFEERRRVTVTDGGVPVRYLNELEWINGEIWANVWGRDRIARIGASTGEVRGWIDLSSLWPRAARPGSDAVLNGIAYDARRRRLLVTGKYWPYVFEVRVRPSA